MTYEQAKTLLDERSQRQLLAFWDELSEEERGVLLDKISSLDFEIVKNAAHPQDLSGRGSLIRPIEGLSVARIEENRERYAKIGNDALRKGKAAALLLAGGQGTRLGADGPKGAFNIGETKELSIFACQMNNLKAEIAESGVFPYLLVMTSDKNDVETRAFWEKNEYFGYPREKVRFFVQETAPCCSFDGKILLEEKYLPATSPNGNGGWFSSLKKCGLYDELKSSGVEWINVYAVDNVLQRPLDPVFLGATIESGVNCGAKAVRKCDENEKVGVLCKKDGKAAVIEYYEMTKELAALRDEQGELVYSYGVILNYFFSLSRLEETEKEIIPVHVVKKKIACVDERGEKYAPETENGYKFETLAVDLISFMGSVLPYEVERGKEFAPVKNAEGKDSVQTAREALKALGVEL